MDKQKIGQVFEEVLERWKSAEQYVINDWFSNIENEQENLEEEYQKYKKSFYKLLEKL